LKERSVTRSADSALSIKTRRSMRIDSSYVNSKDWITAERK